MSRTLRPMTDARADQLLTAVFTAGERKFLLTHPEFKTVVAGSTEDDILELSNLGVKLLLHGEYVPPPPKQSGLQAS